MFVPGPQSGPVQSSRSSMAPEEDEALLFLIYQHLKVNGYKKAAKVLEKHVTQVRSYSESATCTT